MAEEVLDDGIEVQNDASVNITDDKATYPFKNTNPEELGKTVQDFLIKQGYKLESGTNTSGVYGKGSKTLRILLGAFVKRFTWGIKITQDGEYTTLHFSKDEKGYWGGIIGVSQVKSEFKRITEVLKQFHNKHHGA